MNIFKYLQQSVISSALNIFMVINIFNGAMAVAYPQALSFVQVFVMVFVYLVLVLFKRVRKKVRSVDHQINIK